MKVRASVISVKEQFHGVSSLFVDAKPLLKQLPKILGKDKEKHISYYSKITTKDAQRVDS